MGYIIDAIKGIRNARAEMNVPNSKKASLLAYVKEDAVSAFKTGIIYFEKLASVSDMTIIDDKKDVPKNSVAVVTEWAELFMPLFDLIDRDKELERLNKEKERLLSEIERVEKKLSNASFVNKAPQKVVEEEKQKGEKYKEMLKAVLERIESLG